MAMVHGHKSEFDANAEEVTLMAAHGHLSELEANYEEWQSNVDKMKQCFATNSKKSGPCCWRVKDGISDD